MKSALCRLGGANGPGFVIAALYKFTDLPDHRDLQPRLQELCDAHGVHGTLLLADEGINGTVCAPPAGMAAVLDWIEADDRFDGLSLKFSVAPKQAFLRMKVRLKKEIVTMGRPEISPARATGTYVEPEDWNRLVEDPDVMVIDTRNAYETAIGSFSGAVDPQTDSFREFPDWAQSLADAEDRPKKLAMFCTGGIRCEKASALMQQMGFDEVYHLKGGILKYLEDVPAEESRWQGECFVFDGRVAVDHALRPGSYDMCHACRMPLSEEDKTHSAYSPGVSCHHCIGRHDADSRSRFAERQKQIALARQRGEDHLGAGPRGRTGGKQGG
ncbi:MAG: rhodanese-related sulfurtransferase [Candidatus Puniceispirillaceae bacterium]